MIDIIHSCFEIGLSGRCGLDCPIFQASNCESHIEMLNNISTYGELEEYESLYGQVPLSILVTMNLKIF